jgi:hypothetical protein
MIEQSWEDALEVVVGFLEAPPEPDSDAGRRFDQALTRVLAGAPKPVKEDFEAAPALDLGLRQRLDDLSRRRAVHNPFGDHPDGIGPTLGMNLGER